MTDNKDTVGERSGQYPYCPLALCLPIAEAVKSVVGSGNSEASKALVSVALKTDEKSRVLQFKIISARTFGLIEGKAKFKLTDAAKQYYFPTTSQDRQKALLHFLQSPSAFKAIVDRLDGNKLPENSLLANILHREAGVPGSWKERVAKIFLSSAKTAGAVDDQDYLRVRATLDGVVKPSGPTDNRGVNSLEEARTSPPRSVRRDPFDTPIDLVGTDEAPSGYTAWSYRHKGKQIRLQTPEELSEELWQKLNAYVQILKPIEEKP